jgi:hypothetical protein
VYPVRDEKGIETGRMEVRISCKDSQLFLGEESLKGDSFAMSKFVERDVIGKIAEKLAVADIESIDMIFDMLI